MLYSKHWRQSMSDTESGIQSMGGKARAKKLTGEERQEIAKRAAFARWNKTGVGIPKATHEGIITIGDMEIPCAVLDNGRRVLSENGITYALLGSRSGASKRLKRASQEHGAHTPLLLAPKNLKPFISNELLDGPLKPLTYQQGERII